jgi:hypothetical protein
VTEYGKEVEDSDDEFDGPDSDILLGGFDVAGESDDEDFDACAAPSVINSERYRLNDHGIRHALDKIGDQEQLHYAAGKEEASARKINPMPQECRAWILGRSGILGVNPFVRNLTGRRGMHSFRGMEPCEIVEHYMVPMWRHTIECTNKRLSALGITSDMVTIDEMRVLHGLRGMMSFCKLPQTRMYWEPTSISVFEMPNFKQFMSYKRYKLICKHLCFEDYDNVSQEIKDADKAWKIRPIFQILQRLFKDTLPAPNEYQSADEGMGRMFGRAPGLKRYMPDKPIQEGFKFFLIVDYLTGVCHRINMDDGGISSKNSEQYEWGATGQYILALVGDLPGTGYKMFLDNFYSSPALFYELKTRYNIYAVGTLRTDRGVIAPLMLKASRPTKKVPKGTVKCAYSQNQQLHMFAVMDSKACYFLDAAYGSSEFTLLRRKQDDGSYSSALMPHAMFMYNRFMGGVDLWDMVRTGWYGCEMRGRCRRWTLRFYEILFSMACANAYMIFTFNNNIKKDFNAHYIFHKQVVEGLLSGRDKHNTTPASSTRSTNKRNAEEISTDHIYKETEQGTAGDNCGNRRRRGFCAAKCGKKVSWHCKTCSEALNRLIFICPECNGNNKFTHV